MQRRQDEISLNLIGMSEFNRKGIKVYTHNGPDILSINVKTKVGFSHAS